MPQNYISRRLTRKLHGSEICVVVVMRLKKDESAASQEASGQTGYEWLGRPGKGRKRWGFSLPHCWPSRDRAAVALCSLMHDAHHGYVVQMQN